jgi:peptidyl-prolyl cis-trans isomerase C
MRKTIALALLPLAAALFGCDGVGQALSSHTDALARAAGHELTVDRAAALVAPHAAIPAQPEVVDAIATLWVDYTLLATAASQDTTLANVNLDLLLRPYIEQEVVWKLRESVISVDTAITEEELRTLFDQEQPGLQVRARHILLALPADAAPAVRDSVTQLAESLQTRAAGGEDFAELARQYSSDGSAAQGGDLGFFGRNQMVEPFEQAAFALQPGEVSDIVQTPFGLHIIKVEERQTASFDEMRETFRQSASQLKVQQAEEKYITDLTEPRNIEVQDGAVLNAKEMARNPGMSLSGRAADRSLVRYEGGALAASEFLDVMRAWSAQNRAALSSADDEQVEQVLEGLSRNEILIEEARKRNLGMSETEQDSLREAAQVQLKRAALEAGLIGIQPQDGETMNQAIERKVNTSIEAILKGEQNVVPLGPLSFSLRQQFGGEVFSRAFDETVTRIVALRPEAPQGPPGMPMPGTGGVQPPPVGGAPPPTTTTTGQ